MPEKTCNQTIGNSYETVIKLTIANYFLYAFNANAHITGK